MDYTNLPIEFQGSKFDRYFLACPQSEEELNQVTGRIKDGLDLTLEMEKEAVGCDHLMYPLKEYLGEGLWRYAYQIITKQAEHTYIHITTGKVGLGAEKTQLDKQTVMLIPDMPTTDSLNNFFFL